MIEQTLLADLHNGGQIMVEGNSTSIDILKERLIQDVLVKFISIYQHPEPRPETVGPALVKVQSINYTQLKELRKPPTL